jgi:hypothetical protein
LPFSTASTVRLQMRREGETSRVPVELGEFCATAFKVTAVRNQSPVGARRLALLHGGQCPRRVGNGVRIDPGGAQLLLG